MWNSQTALASVLVETSMAPKAKGKLVENFISNNNSSWWRKKEIKKEEEKKKKMRKKFEQIHPNTA